MDRVLNIISDTNIDGAGRVLLNYLKYHDRTQFDISVALPKNSALTESIRALQVPVREVDISADKSYDRVDVKKLTAVIRELNPDLVHTHGSMSGRIAARRCGKKIIYTRHSVFPVSPRVRSGPGRLLNKLINEHYADRIIAVSPAARDNLTDAGISPDLIDIVMNGVEPVVRSSADESRILREKYGIPEGCFTAGILARIEEYKGHLLIAEAADILRSEGRDFRILMAGKGAFEETLKAKLRDLQLTDRVLFLGFVSDVAGLLSILDVQLNASFGTEATSLSLLEGMSIGLPSVVSSYGGNPWLIENDVTGLVFESGDSRALARALASCMDSPELLKRLGQNAGQTFIKTYTGEIYAGNIEKIYRKTLRGEQDGK